MSSSDPGAAKAPVVAVPASAVIDSGTRKVVLIAKGEGRFEPRAVKLGNAGGGYVEMRDGVKSGEEVVTSAKFLIDAESNLKAALQGSRLSTEQRRHDRPHHRAGRRATSSSC